MLGTKACNLALLLESFTAPSSTFHQGNPENREEESKEKKKEEESWTEGTFSVLAELLGLALGRVRPPVTSTVRVPVDPSGPWDPNPFFLYSRPPTSMDDSHLVFQRKFVQSA